MSMLLGGRLDALAVTEGRPISHVATITVSGAVEVRFFSDALLEELVVTANTPEAIQSVTTLIVGDELRIERRELGQVISPGGGGSTGTVVVASDGGIAAGGDVYVNGRRLLSGDRTDFGVNPGRCVVGVVLQHAPSLLLAGSGDVTYQDLDQTALSVRLVGSGSFEAQGMIERFEADLAGSGSVDATDLTTWNAKVSVTGSGSIEVDARSGLGAVVVGSGSVVVSGNPKFRNVSVVGSGDVSFKD